MSPWSTRRLDHTFCHGTSCGSIILLPYAPKANNNAVPRLLPAQMRGLSTERKRRRLLSHYSNQIRAKFCSRRAIVLIRTEKTGKSSRCLH